MTKLAEVQVANLNYNSQALDCDQMYSKVMDWVSKGNIQCPQTEKPQAPSFHTKQNIKHPPHAYQRYSTLVIYCTQSNQLVANTCC